MKYYDAVVNFIGEDWQITEENRHSAYGMMMMLAFIIDDAKPYIEELFHTIVEINLPVIPCLCLSQT